MKERPIQHTARGELAKYTYDVFISYAHADDSKYMDRFLDDLRQQIRLYAASEVRFWQDKHFSVGEDPDTMIPLALRKSATLLVLVSGKSLSREWVAKEYRLFKNSMSIEGANLKKRVFTVLVDTLREGGHVHEDLAELHESLRDAESIRRQILLVKLRSDYHDKIEEIGRKIAMTLSKVEFEHDG